MINLKRSLQTAIAMVSTARRRSSWASSANWWTAGGAAVDPKMRPVLRYARKLTQQPSNLTQADADAIFAAGWEESALYYTVAVTAHVLACIELAIQPLDLVVQRYPGRRYDL